MPTIKLGFRLEQHPSEGTDKGNGRDQLLGAPTVLGRPDILRKRWIAYILRVVLDI